MKVNSGFVVHTQAVEINHRIIHVERKWACIALLYFVLIALEGTLLRLILAGGLDALQYRYLLHSHSHVAMLGWIFNMLLIALLHMYLPTTSFTSSGYRWLFRLIQVSVVGMLFSFIWQGYAAVSITFSTLHILLSYWFIIRLLRDIIKDKAVRKKYAASLPFAFAALFFLFVSSFGPWGLAVISARGLAQTDLYHQAIYFYLHFLYNGCFTFLILALVVWLLECDHQPFSTSRISIAFWILFIFTLPAYALSLLGFTMPHWIFTLAQITGVGQCIGYLVFFSVVYQKVKLFGNHWAVLLIKFALMAGLLKFIMQLVSGFPPFLLWSFGMRDMIIGFIHLVMIGFVSVGLIGWAVKENLFSIRTQLSRMGMILFFAGFLLMESLLFLQSLLVISKFAFLPDYPVLLLGVSFMIFVGMAIFWYTQMKLQPKTKTTV